MLRQDEAIRLKVKPWHLRQHAALRVVWLPIAVVKGDLLERPAPIGIQKVLVVWTDRAGDDICCGDIPQVRIRLEGYIVPHPLAAGDRQGSSPRRQRQRMHGIEEHAIL
jgi:hypothetical protein